ncbi:DUF6624 domain-containing protein [Neolewinella antarctica]|uniref:Uncharacterized protein n=1 Tax=Neolewinella antarctica TaxID=442734 RepID=A0ABX0XG92_9BACT|nr:DUF6624 domain-containing protein [Neolewinella antarctica]NJC27767.1 hypothetical protein [Neolewinella antarctica]
MRSTFLTLLLLTILGTGVRAQNFSSTDPAYAENVTLGEAKLIAAEYDSCLVYYATAFAIKSTSFLSTMRAAACAHSAGESTLRDIYLDHAFGLSPDGAASVFKSYDEFAYLQETPFAGLVEERFAVAFPNFNQRLADTLAEVQRTDQEQRGQMSTVGDQYGYESPQMDSLWAIQNFSDSVNTIYVTKLIDSSGYPGKSIVGEQAGTAFLVIQHADLGVQEKYLPVLRSAAEAGELNYRSLALLIDRIEQRNDRPQIYGSQVGRDTTTGDFYFFPIAEPYKVDSLRETVGLGALTDYAKRWNFSYDPAAQVARQEAATKVNKD